MITISIVHSPCVPLAKFCSLKNNNQKVSHMTKELNEQLEENVIIRYYFYYFFRVIIFQMLFLKYYILLRINIT